jgi:hypothetical protein
VALGAVTIACGAGICEPDGVRVALFVPLLRVFSILPGIDRVFLPMTRVVPTVGQQVCDKLTLTQDLSGVRGVDQHRQRAYTVFTNWSVAFVGLWQMMLAVVVLALFGLVGLLFQGGYYRNLEQYSATYDNYDSMVRQPCG